MKRFTPADWSQSQCLESTYVKNGDALVIHTAIINAHEFITSDQAKEPNAHLMHLEYPWSQYDFESL